MKNTMTKQASNARLSIGAVLIIATVSFGLYPGLVQAGEIELELTGAEQVPPVESKGSGNGEISVTDDGAVSGSVMVSGIMGTAAHIHIGAVGESGPPAVTLIKNNNTYSVPADTMLTVEQLENFKQGNLYVNIHTEANPSGELRAQLIP